MSFKYINKKNLIYYLHKVVKDNGEIEYFFSRQEQKNDLEGLPEGYKIVEESNGKFVIKKIN